MSSDLTREEMEVIRKLQDAHLSYPEAALATLMFTREHARPASELVNIIDVYLRLDNQLEMQQAIQKLKRMDWLITSTSFGLEITKAVPDLQQKIADYIQDPAALQRLVQSRADSTQMLPPNIQLLGPMTDERNYGTFLDLLRNARDEVCLPMLTTPPYDDTVAILQERARKGVNIRILLASPKVAKSIRGETTAEKAKKAISSWKEAVQGHPKMEVRISHLAEDMCHMATSWTLDRRLLRYDFYDPRNQRSLEGYMIEFDSRTKLELNIISLFQARFDEAWNHAQPLNVLRVVWGLKTNWQWVAFVITALAAIPLGTSILGNIIISVSATFLFNALITSSSTIKSAIIKLLS